MKYFFKKIILIFTMTMMNNFLSAGILIEPMINHDLYAVSGWKNSNKLTYSGVSFGGRFGVQFLGFMGGLEYDYRPKSSYKTEVYKDGYFSGHYSALFAGYQLPLLGKAWIGYFFNIDLKDKVNDLEFKEKGTLLGVGFTVLPLVDLNLEYRKFHVKKNSYELLFGISIPFVL